MRALQGVGVLVTRPDGQAAALCSLLESHGADVSRFPALRILPIEPPHALAQLLNPIGPFDLIIFTSANAVTFGMPWLDLEHAPLLAAIGPATARRLEQAGWRALVAPDGSDSESLLRHLESTGCSGRRILIVKGRGGRQHLEVELAQRGARVLVADVYERERVPYGPDAITRLEQQFAGGGIDIVTATSVEILTALLDMATPALARAFDRVSWVVASARVATALRGSGMTAPVLLADSAEDHALVEAIVRWRSSVSAA